MIRRFNYTGRQRINRSDVTFRLSLPPGGTPRASVDLSLENYSLPAEADVHIEAYRQINWMRFDVGTVGDLWNTGPHLLSEFLEPEAVLFRVRVTASATAGRVLLAEADRIPWHSDSDSAGGRSPLLIPRGEDLGDELWRLDLSGDTTLLLVNRQLGDWRAIARKPEFIYSVYPNALRMILSSILLIELDNADWDADDTDSWQGRWLAFAGRLPGMSSLPDDAIPTDRLDWIEQAVQEFCCVSRLRKKCGRYFVEEPV